ncbi:putative P-loop containing nucleoside triphosphate hydrolase, leucine-rich repeat domain, L [Rosa chinensis]|uniref:Putative P-loop containing nucleoside triphosphate hydrolase, leucine-rich repeat domain, L n=1 Tax=Rosa chinensis TaxID=74649 RepID=A0A2P6SI20_ROSCH|nr:putative P-loop containing nucleoside triphosphate hydrolase, leucine-rich repeat domain, L [Rosa chinensis]
MAEAVVSMVIHGLRPLGSLMIQQAMFFNGVGDKVELAQTELLLMQGFLKDADARQENEEVVRLWVNIIRDAAYDLEDAIESFVLKVAFKREASVKVVLKRFACFLCKGVDRYKIGLEIESITTKLSRLRLTMQSYDIKQEKGNEGAATSMRQRERRLTYPHVIDHDVVGLGDDTEMLATNLVEEKGPQVVTIWGMGGSGKTTLAKQIYNHKKVKSHFDCFAWVCISQQCDGTAVMKEIFIKLSGVSDERRQGIANLSNDEVAERLCNFQRHRKCLVVIDDIWTLDAWNSFKGGFSVNEETESRILLTTRNREVASLARGNGLLYESQALSADESWNLFRKIAFFEMDDTNSDSQIYSKKEELGKNMLQHCAGLPLAIIVLAGLLARKDTIDEWETVHKNVNVYIRRGTDLEREYKGQKHGGASWVLALSYDNLPYRLKLCFLYSANFPEDYEIPVKRLTQLWMAEGFISTTSTEMMEDVSYSCLSELVERCMVQVVDIGLSGKIKTCRLHDLMRDLCLLKAEEENFLHVVNFSTGTRTNTTQVGRVRRVAMYVNNTVDQLVPTTRGAPLRSLLCFGPQYFWNKKLKKVIRSVFNDFKLLRVLELEGMGGLEKLPSTIGNLVHLRFLSLKRSRVENLPLSVANLVCLQTLDLRTGSLMKIPNVFKKMEQLRHLYLPWYYYRVRGELSLPTACNLQTLVNVECENCDFNALVELYNLRKLSIQDWADVKNWKKLEEFLKSRSSPTFHHLRSLSLRLYGHDSLTDLSGFRFIYKLRLVGTSIKELPENLLSFPNLITIKLVETQLKGDQIEILEKLPHLRVLYLRGRVFSSLPSNTLVCSNRGFPNLEFLSLGNLHELKKWRVEEGAMPRLRRLCIDTCEKLRAVPDGLQYVATLKELTVKCMPSKFCSRLGEDGEDFHKIKHVPSLIITGTEQRDLEDLRKEREKWRKKLLGERVSRRTWTCLK